MRRVADADAPGEAGRLALTKDGGLWLGVTLLLAAVGWWKTINPVLLLAYLMLAMLVVNGFLARLHARRVTARRDPVPPAYAGEEVVVRVEAANTGTRPATATVHDAAGEGPSAWLVHRLPPGESAPFAARRTFPVRGRSALPLLVWSGYPFGLLRSDREVPAGEVVVLPAVGAADADGLRGWVLRYSQGDGRTRKVLRRVTADPADVRGVRPYRPGDPIRSVHWRSSARRRELMVREYDAAPAPELVLVVEPWLPADPSRGHEDAVEAALCLAATAARAWVRGFGTAVTVAVAGDPSSVRTATPTEDGIRAALEPLAGVAGGSAFDPLSPGAFDRSLARSARVVVSSRRASPYPAALARSTGRPFLAVCPQDRPGWYQPPAGVIVGSGQRAVVG